jgi:hypothetical protein
MAKGDVKAGKSSIIGTTGEYFVMAELLRRGWVAGQTPRGAPDFDILAIKGARRILVRVKTKTEDSKLFRWNLRKDGRFFGAVAGENDFCILVDIGGTAYPKPEYWINPTREVEKKLQRNKKRLFRGKAGTVVGIKFGRDDEWLSKSKCKWLLLEKR